MTHNTQVAGPYTQTGKLPTSLRQKRPPGPHENWLIVSSGARPCQQVELWAR
jgi:hypothetical protein